MNRLTVIRFRAVIGECINIPTYLFTQLIKGDAHIGLIHRTMDDAEFYS